MYTGNLDHDLEAILPLIVADTVTGDIDRAQLLVQRARRIYKANPTWGKKIARDNEKARDLLKAFMIHWQESIIQAGIWDRITPPVELRK